MIVKMGESTKEESKSFYNLLITEIPILAILSAFLIAKALLQKLLVTEIVISLLILLPFLTLLRFISIFWLSKRNIDNLNLMYYLAFTSIPFYSLGFFLSLITVELIIDKFNLTDIGLLTSAFLSGTTILSLLSLGILIDSHFDPRKSQKGVSTIRIPVTITVISFLGSVILIFSIILLNTYSNSNFSILDLIILNLLTAVSVFITLKKVYNTISKDIKRIKRSLLLATEEQVELEKTITTDELRDVPKVTSEISADFKLKDSLVENVIDSTISTLNKIKENYKAILLTIGEHEKSKELEIRSIKHNLKNIEQIVTNSIESLKGISITPLKSNNDEKDITKKLSQILVNEGETMNKALGILNSVNEGLRKIQDNMPLFSRDMPNLLNDIDKMFNYIREIKNIGFKLANISVTLDIELAKTKYNKQKLSVISNEIRRVSENISEKLSTVEIPETEKYKVEEKISSFIESFSTSSNNLNNLITLIEESSNGIKKVLAILNVISKSHTSLDSSLTNIEYEINYTTDTLYKVIPLLSDYNKALSSIETTIKDITEPISSIKLDIEDMIDEIENILKEVNLNTK